MLRKGDTAQRRKMRDLQAVRTRRSERVMLVMSSKTILWEELICGKLSGHDVATVVRWRCNWAVNIMNRDRIPLRPDPLCVLAWG